MLSLLGWVPTLRAFPSPTPSSTSSRAPLCLVALVAYRPQTLLLWNLLLFLPSFLTLMILEVTLAPWGCGCQATAWH